MSQKSAMSVAKDYVNSVCENDISRVDGKQRNPKIVRQIMRSYARNISTLAKEIEDGAKHLLEIRRLIQEYNKTEKQVPLREPDFSIVLTGGKMAYTRTDGVQVIPLACLKD